MTTRIHALIETVDGLLEQIDETYTSDLKLAKKFAQDLREELEELLETRDDE